MDNLTLFGNRRAQLREWQREIAAFVETRLGLALGSHAAVRPCTASILYLGYALTRQGHTAGPRAIARFERSLERLVGRTGFRSRDLARLERSMSSYRGVLLF